MSVTAVSAVPGLQLVLPPGLHALPLELDETGTPDPDAFERCVRSLAPTAGEDRLLVIGAHLLRFLRLQDRSPLDVGLTCLGLLDDEQGGVAPMTVTVSRTPSAHTDTECALDGIVELLTRGRDVLDGPADVRRLELPCGPAVVDTRFERREVGDPAAPDEERFLDLGRFDVHVPHPTLPWVAVISISSPALHVWGAVSALAAAVVWTLSFPAPA